MCKGPGAGRSIVCVRLRKVSWSVVHGGERQVKKERGPMKQDKGSGIQSEHKKLP